MNKEIEVWVSKSLVIHDDTDCRNIFRSGGDESCVNRNLFTKARLIFEIPEKKIQITESCFDELFDDHKGANVKTDYHKFLKQKLFGEKS